MTGELFRMRIEQAITEAGTSGMAYRDILAELSTVMGKFVAAGSPNRATRLSLVKSSMVTVAAALDRH